MQLLPATLLKRKHISSYSGNLIYGTAMSLRDAGFIRVVPYTYWFSPIDRVI